MGEYDWVFENNDGLINVYHFVVGKGLVGYTATAKYEYNKETNKEEVIVSWSYNKNYQYKGVLTSSKGYIYLHSQRILGEAEHGLSMFQLPQDLKINNSWGVAVGLSHEGYPTANRTLLCNRDLKTAEAQKEFDAKGFNESNSLIYIKPEDNFHNIINIDDV